MISLDDFSTLIRDLSIKTGKSPLLYGKKLADQKALDYAVGVMHSELRQYEHMDIEAAFNDSALQDEVAAGYSGITCSILRKYIKIHKGKREEERNREELFKKTGENKPIPAECVEALAEKGIYLKGAVKSMPDGHLQLPEDKQRRRELLRAQGKALREEFFLKK